MTKEPIDKYFGVSMSEWIEKVPNELDVDAVGLWQIIPVGIDSFGLEGDGLDEFIHRCIMALLQRGAIPVTALSGVEGWIPDIAYRGSHEEIAKQIINKWKSQELVPDHDGLWFSLPKKK